MARTKTEIKPTFGAPTEVETLARRAARTDAPKSGLHALTALRKRLDELEVLQVSMALEAGLSWTRIARALGISRQAAHKRYSRRVGCRDGSSGAPLLMLVTAEARHAVHLARQEARDLGSDLVGTEHLLLGILRCERSHATWVLRAMGARLDDLRAAVATLECGQGESISGEQRHPAWRELTSHARVVLERSLEEAMNRGEGYIGVEHLLLAVLRDSPGGAVQALRRANIDPHETLSRLLRL